MKTLIVFDSFFGNTEQVARAIGAALAGENDVVCMRVADVTPGLLAGVKLLIVGSPTRGFRPTPAISAFIDGVPAGGLNGVAVATFDTRITPEEVKSIVYTPLAKIFGYAAKPMVSKLEGRGAKAVALPEGFHVMGEKGPLKEGELERATAWAKRMNEELRMKN